MRDSDLRILFVEDSPEDVDLETHELRKGGLSFESLRVDTREALLGALADFKPTLILSDFTLPQLDGAGALRIARERAPEVPFLFVSGTIGEERAIESLKSGATDYVVKERLSSLLLKVQRALRESRVRAQQRRLEEQLKQAQRMDAVGRLAGGVGSTFSNHLTVIKGFTELMLSQLLPDSPLRGYAEEVLAAGDRAASLTRELLAFSRRQLLRPEVLNLNVVVSGAEPALRKLLGSDIELLLRLDPGIGNIKADAGQMEQVLRNLALNARDAMPHGGELKLETANVLLDEEFARRHLGSRPGPHVQLSVTDSGIGMDADTRSHLFEPFFTTKDLGKGAGLGLATVYGIVRQSGGSILVASDVGSGACFRLHFPLIADEAPPPSSASGAGGSSRGTETLLVVEDSDPVRRLLVTVLAQQGYAVLAAADAEEALRTAAQHAGPLHLLVTDVGLPQMPGPELARRLRRSRPALRVLFTSGSSGHSLMDQGSLEPGAAFLQKPFVPGTLAGKVRQVLDQA